MYMYICVSYKFSDGDLVFQDILCITYLCSITICMHNNSSNQTILFPCNVSDREMSLKYSNYYWLLFHELLLVIMNGYTLYRLLYYSNFQGIL